MPTISKLGKQETDRTLQKMFIESYDREFDQNAVEIVGYDGQALQRINAINMAIQIERDGSGNPIYLGLAAPGTATSVALWQIRKLTFDGQNDVTAIEYADGDSDFDNVWDDRAGGSYS